MGRSKIYRQNLKDLIKSVSTKTLYQWLVEQTRTRFGVALQEAELIAEKAEFFLIKVWETSLGAQFVFHLHSGNSNHQKNCPSHISSAPVRLTAYKNDDLDILMKLGLKAMQNSRICRLIEEAYFHSLTNSYVCFQILLRSPFVNDSSHCGKKVFVSPYFSLQRNTENFTTSVQPLFLDNILMVNLYMSFRNHFSLVVHNGSNGFANFC